MSDDPVVIREGAILDIEQGSRAWFEARMGIVTASDVWKVSAFMKVNRGEKKVGDETQARLDYKLDKVCEMLTGKFSEHYKTYWMERGTRMEPEARRAYESFMEIDVDRVGFVLHPTFPRFGASPDCLVDDEGLAEFKCPKDRTHYDYFTAGVIPPAYIPQMTAQLACTGRQWCDFVSYCPSFEGPAQLFIRRLERNEKAIAQMEKDVERFIAEVDVLHQQFREKIGQPGEVNFEKVLKESIRRAQTRRKLEHEREEMPDELFITDGDINL